LEWLAMPISLYLRATLRVAPRRFFSKAKCLGSWGHGPVALGDFRQIQGYTAQMTRHLRSNCKIEDPLLFALYLAEDTTSADGGQLWASLISNRWSRLGSDR